MKKIIVLLLLTIAGVAAWYIWETRKKPKDETPKDRIVAPSKFSNAFNNSISTTLNAYYALSEAFVNWDTVGITAAAQKLRANIDSIDFRETRTDSATNISKLNSLKSNLQEISSNKDLTVKRDVFNTFSKNFFSLLQNIQYDNAIVYLQKCPMAFNDTGTGVWLSSTDEIRNPYLGMHHPKYGKGMLECGENESKIDFTGREGK